MVRAADPLAADGGKPEWAMSRRERERAILARHGLAPRRRWPWVLALLVAAVLAGAWWWREPLGLSAVLPGASAQPDREAEASPPDAPPSEAEAPPPAQINATEWATLEPVTLRRVVEVIGPLDPGRRAEISAQTSGRVQEVAVRPGDAVTAGQVLVRLDTEPLALELALATANLDSTRAQLRLAQGQLDRARSLVDRGVSAPTTLDDPEANLASLRASVAAQEDQVAVARLALRNAEVVAPFDGQVAARSVEPGAVVASGASLLSLVDLSEVEMLASAPVSAGAGLRAGQPVEVAVDGIAGRTYPGEVARVAPVTVEGTRTLTVFVRLANPDATLLGGMFATGTIITEEAEGALAVPEAAILEDDEGPHVLVIEGDALARRAVTPGEAWEGGLVQVMDGLRPGDRVVTAALSGLEPGRAVELVEY